MQARFYAPMYGRFLSPDPARDQHFEQTQSWNIYSYVQNDPTMRIDPNGLFWQDPKGFPPVEVGDREGSTGQVWNWQAGVVINVHPMDMKHPYKEPVLAVGGAAVVVATAGAAAETGVAASTLARVSVAVGAAWNKAKDAGSQLATRLGNLFSSAPAGQQAAKNPAEMEEAMKAADVSGVIKSAGMDLKQAGNFFGWGKDMSTGKTFVGAVQNFSKAGLQKAGWTLEKLQSLGRAYQQVADANPNNPSAAMRAQQMRDLANLYKK